MQRLVKLPDKFLASEVDGELILVHGDTGAFFALKDVGLAIWKKLDEHSELDSVCADLCREFDVSESHCEQSVARFASELVEAGLAEFV